MRRVESRRVAGQRQSRIVDKRIVHRIASHTDRTDGRVASASRIICAPHASRQPSLSLRERTQFIIIGSKCCRRRRRAVRKSFSFAARLSPDARSLLHCALSLLSCPHLYSPITDPIRSLSYNASLLLAQLLTLFCSNSSEVIHK